MESSLFYLANLAFDTSPLFYLGFSLSARSVKFQYQ